MTGCDAPNCEADATHPVQAPGGAGRMYVCSEHTTLFDALPTANPPKNDDVTRANGRVVTDGGTDLKTLLDEHGPAKTKPNNRGNENRLHFPTAAEDDRGPCPALSRADEERMREVETVGEAPLRASVCAFCDPRDEERESVQNITTDGGLEAGTGGSS